MSSAGWSERLLTPRALVGVVVAALGLLVLAFAVEVAIRPADYINRSDVPRYEAYGSEVVGGSLPYRDFQLEYPPGALPLFVLPATSFVARGSTEGASWTPMNAAASRYHRGFASLVLVLAAAMLVLTALSLSAVRRSTGTVLLSLAVVASSPLLIGDVFPDRFDVWPAALTAAALAASVRGRYRLGGTALGLGAAAKIYPALLLPVLFIVVARHRGPREAILVASVAIAAAAVVFLPFAIVAFADTWESLRLQFQDGLQIETLTSSVLVMAGHAQRELAALGLPPPSSLSTRGVEHGLNRDVLVGPGIGATATVLNVLLVAALCSLWISLLRSKADPREDLVRYAAATVATSLVLGTVLSAQYVTWLIPLVPLVGGRRGTAATLTLALAAALTHVWYPWGYSEYQPGLAAGPTALLLARNLALVATALVLVIPAGALRSRRPTPVTPMSI